MKLKFLNLCPILSLLFIQFSLAVSDDLVQCNNHTPMKTEIMRPVLLTDQMLKNRYSNNQHSIVNNDSANEKIIAMSKLGRLKIVKSLVEDGVNVNIRGDDGLTPLMKAAFFGRFSVVEYLVNKGADVNAKANDGSTALQLATLGQHWEIVDFLKAHMPYKKEVISPFGISLHTAD